MFLRSAAFNHNNFARDAHLVYLSGDYTSYKNYIVGPLYKTIEEKKKSEK